MSHLNLDGLVGGTVKHDEASGEVVGGFVCHNAELVLVVNVTGAPGPLQYWPATKVQLTAKPFRWVSP